MTKLPAALILAALAAPAYAEPPKTIVLVHGAFADGSSWDRVTPLLTAKGFAVVAVHESLGSLDADVDATKRAIEAAPGKVILVGHSYGGAVITEAGASDKVAALVYVAAFVPDKGESINDLGKGQPPPPWITKLIVDRAGFATLPPDVVEKEFAQDLPAAEARLLASKQGPIAAKSFDVKLGTAAWRTKPSWYLRAEDDHMIAPAGQALMAKRASSKVTSIKASHVAMLSHPKDVAAVIIAAAATK